MIVGRMKMMGFKGILIFDIWIEIQGCGRMELVVLKFPSKDLSWISNLLHNLFSCMRHGGLVFGSNILELLPEFFHMEYHCFGFI